MKRNEMKEKGAQVVAERKKRMYFRAHSFAAVVVAIFYVAHKSLNFERVVRKN